MAMIEGLGSDIMKKIARKQEKLMKVDQSLACVKER